MSRTLSTPSSDTFWADLLREDHEDPNGFAMPPDEVKEIKNILRKVCVAVAQRAPDDEEKGAGTSRDAYEGYESGTAGDDVPIATATATVDHAAEEEARAAAAATLCGVGSFSYAAAPAPPPPPVAPRGRGAAAPSRPTRSGRTPA